MYKNRNSNKLCEISLTVYIVYSVIHIRGICLCADGALSSSWHMLNLNTMETTPTQHRICSTPINKGVFCPTLLDAIKLAACL